MQRLNALIAAAALAAFAFCNPVAAQTFPSKPVRIVTPVGPGSPADVLCRLYADGLAPRIGQQVLIENRPGGNSLIGVEAVLTAPADGHTLICFNGGNMAPALHKSLPWDFLKVAAPVIGIYRFGSFLVVNGKLPVNSAQEFIAYAKANPGKLNYFQLVPTQKIGFALFAARAGINIVEIPFKGPDGYAALLAGTVHAGLDGPVSFRGGQIESGQVKMLFTAAEQRSPLMPNVPTAREAGLGDLILPSGIHLWTRAGSPNDAIMRLNAAMNEVIKTPQIVESIRQTGGVAMGGGPEVLLRATEADFKIWAEGARIAKYEPQ